ncbi:uncharacterized protein HMPREF1541_07500 [Cyphellophora europaea CBS 101466]|uniref:AAA+ ATPase domain-containing protein n=1 Tax=Cyphellophora europaea (strain CBS 101466) TaxID=1220924 RepID=W2RN62_CYPE1|nr:uncharacterized protein HMPREF1541_07500 [Cyphellophora europaea CBS 101466]ETN37877.1 hypothetical protein HMPREF1541_07500 [Cyphellophora europaea CBS 101466]
MDPSRRRPAAGPVAAVSSFSSTAIELPEYIVSTFMPSLQPLLAKYPLAFRMIGVVLALWYFGPLSRIQSLWTRFSSLLVSSVNVASDEDLFDYLVTHLSEANTIRADQSLNALSNAPRETPRRGMREPPEESNRRATANNEPPKLKYEQTQGTQLFIHRRRLFWAVRKPGEGHTFTGSRYKIAENLSISCLGRSTTPIKQFLEHIYRLNKDKERTLTIIRRPYSSGYSSRLAWSRITAKPRRALDTVILDTMQKEMVIHDIEEYMDDSTSSFYGRHGIPYRRGYLFHGPPGVGKTSFALALANKFNLDVYVLTLLDQNLSDSDLISLLNQLPGRSLLLLEDIDTAGLSSRKPKSTVSANTGPASRGTRGGPRGGMGSLAPGRRGNQRAEQKQKASETADSDDEEGGALSSKVSLSGLLNAIDGVAAPEGHILIMTTNKPHELDDALVRAGRISVRVKFENASREQAREIFRRMYRDPSDEAPTSITSIAAAAKKTSITASYSVTESDAEIDALAAQFAETLPEKEFSPADLQDYLLVHKKSPKRAIEGLREWMGRAREEMARKDEEKEVEREVRRERKRREDEGWKETLREVMRAEKDGQKEDKPAEGKADRGDEEDEGRMENMSEDVKGSAKVQAAGLAVGSEAVDASKSGEGA